MKLCILGMGSTECLALEKVLNGLLQELNDDARVVLSDDIDLFLKYKITKTPALLINDRLYQNEQLQNIDLLRRFLIQAKGERE